MKIKIKYKKSNQGEGLMGGVPTEEPKTPDPNETEIPHKEEGKASRTS